MTFETAFLAFIRTRVVIQEAVGDSIFFEEAPQNLPPPYLVLHSITAGGAREVGTQKPWMQIDCFAADKFVATEMAETITASLFGVSYAMDGQHIQSITTERRRPIKVEDGTWKVPIDTRFSYR